MLSVVWTLLVIASTGCTSPGQWMRQGFKVGPNYVEPCVSTSCQWIDANDPHFNVDPVQDFAWWTVFNDATLNQLIDAAYRQNLTVRSAAMRILEARAQRAIAAGNLFPQTQTAVSDYGRLQVSRNLGLPFPPSTSIFADGLNGSWELDFWGRYRRSVETADANLDASVNRYGEALVMLLSEVARNYVQLRTFEQRLEYARSNATIQKGSAELANMRFSRGTATELDVRQARLNVAQTEALIPPLELGRRQAANRLCILLGIPVYDLSSQLPAAKIPVTPPQLAIGVPADLMRRRPDVRRAERAVAAQSAQIGVATSDLYPRLALNGFVGYVANDISDLFTQDSFTGFILPTASWQILNYGRVLNNIRTQDARLEAVALDYQQTVLTAGREVEDALIQYIASHRQARFLEAGVAEAQRSVELVMLQFEGGVTDFNRVYNTQTALVQQQDQLANTQGTIALALVEVYRSMGGGWPNFMNAVAPLAVPRGIVNHHPRPVRSNAGFGY